MCHRSSTVECTSSAQTSSHKSRRFSIRALRMKTVMVTETPKTKGTFSSSKKCYHRLPALVKFIRWLWTWSGRRSRTQPQLSTPTGRLWNCIRSNIQIVPLQHTIVQSSTMYLFIRRRKLRIQLCWDQTWASEKVLSSHRAFALENPSFSITRLSKITRWSFIQSSEGTRRSENGRESKEQQSIRTQTSHSQRSRIFRCSTRRERSTLRPQSLASGALSHQKRFSSIPSFCQAKS